jgi:tripartite-type tricarboxylate transporter receptor subunit TctC
MIGRRKFLSSVAAGLTAATLPALPASAAVKLARLIVGFPPGGSVDFVARLLADQLKTYAETVIVENRGGAGGRIALEALRSAPADGTVMALTPGDQLSLFPHIYKSLPYDAERDFSPVSTVCSVQFLFSVGPMVPTSVETFESFVRWCRENPKKASYGTPGNGTRQHLLGEILAREAGLEFVHVPYNGAPPAMQDLLAGSIAANISVISTAVPHIKAGTVRALLTTARTRSTVLPEVPTAKEVGHPELEATEAFGILLPRSAPVGVIGALNAAIRLAMTSKSVTEGLAKFSFDSLPATPVEYSDIIKADHARWSEIVRATGFKPVE